MITIEKVGTRLYLVNLPFSLKDKAKQDLGCSWDFGRSQWWVGVVKRIQAHEWVDKANAELSAPPAAGADGKPEAKMEDLSGRRIYHKIIYKGKPGWYVIAESRDQIRCQICRLQGDFAQWVATADCVIEKSYPGREVGRGRYTRTEYTTIASLRRFIERQSNPDTRRGCCTECGDYGPCGESCSSCGGEGTYI
jgi:hypothetical protein